MRLLLDTSIVLWVTLQSPRLSQAGWRVINEADAIFVSSISLWEIAIKTGVRKLHGDLRVIMDGIIAAGFEELPVTWQHSLAVRELPLHHRDPFDRMLVAQAQSEPLQLLTGDAELARYGDLVTVV